MLTYPEALIALDNDTPLRDSYDFAYRIVRLRKADATWTIRVRCVDNDYEREWTREHGASLLWLSV